MTISLSLSRRMAINHTRTYSKSTW